MQALWGDLLQQHFLCRVFLQILLDSVLVPFNFVYASENLNEYNSKNKEEIKMEPQVTRD